MKAIILFLIFLSFLFGGEIDYYAVVTKKIKSNIGEERYLSELSSLQKADLIKLQTLLKDKVDVEINKKLSYSYFKIKPVFNLLIKMQKESDSTLPSLYAYNLTMLTYQTYNKEFNKLYGVIFSNKLIESKMCEGYLWRGSIDKRQRETWGSAYQYFTMAEKTCKSPREIGIAKREAMKYKYLSSQGKKQ